MPRLCHVLPGALLGALALAPGESRAQVWASERGSVSQTVDGTVLTVDYGRPQARGRDSLFGKVIPVGETRTPGANAATTLQVTRDVTVGGRPLPAGKYSVWMMLDTGAVWTLYFHKDAALWHTQHPKPTEMALAVRVPHVLTTERAEILTFDFPRVSPTGAQLRLRWGPTTVPVEIGVTPRARPSMTAEQLAPYVGTYGVTFVSPGGGRSPERQLVVSSSGGTLRGALAPPGETMEFEYLPTSTAHQFLTAHVRDGKVDDVEVIPMEFTMVNGRATGLRVVMPDGRPWIEGSRR